MFDVSKICKTIIDLCVSTVKAAVAYISMLIVIILIMGMFGMSVEQIAALFDTRWFMPVTVIVLVLGYKEV